MKLLPCAKTKNIHVESGIPRNRNPFPQEHMALAALGEEAQLCTRRRVELEWSASEPRDHLVPFSFLVKSAGGQLLTGYIEAR